MLFFLASVIEQLDLALITGLVVREHRLAVEPALEIGEGARDVEDDEIAEEEPEPWQLDERSDPGSGEGDQPDEWGVLRKIEGLLVAGQQALDQRSDSVVHGRIVARCT